MPTGAIWEAIHMEQAVQTHEGQDVRWALRATADVLLRSVLIRLVSSSSDYPGLVKQLGSARHVRAPVCGRFASWAEDRQNQCTARTSQRAQSQWRQSILPSLRFECVELVRSLILVPGAESEVSQYQLQTFLELQGWNVSQVVRNQVLNALVEEGYLESRRTRERSWYRPGGRASELPEVDVRAGQLSRWFGMLTSTVAQRFYQEPGFLWAMDLSLPRPLVLQFVERFSEEARRLAFQRATLQGDDLVWFRFSIMTGEQAEPAQRSDLTALVPVLLPLVGDLSHIIGDVKQAEDVVRRYLADVLEEQARESGVSKEVVMSQHGLHDIHTFLRWKDYPQLLDEAAQHTFEGGSVGVLVREMLRVLTGRWPKGSDPSLLHTAVKRQLVRGSSDSGMMGLAFAHLAADPRVQLIRGEQDSVEYRLRQPLMESERPLSGELIQQLQVQLAGIPNFVLTEPSECLTHGQGSGLCLPMERAEANHIVERLRAVRLEIVRDVMHQFEQFKQAQNDDLVLKDLIRSVIVQGCYTPIGNTKGITLL